jgi:phosphoglycerate kinase
LGLPTGKSLVEEDKLDAARDILTHAKARNVDLHLPVDHVVADRIEAGVPSAVLKVNDAAIGDRMGLDIGPETTALYAKALGDAKTVVWNGPMGVFEIEAFAAGTLGVAAAVARITHISTGGGASLEFLGGHALPGVEALPDSEN